MWYIKLPSQDDFTPMQSGSNPSPEIWQQGTTYFKLVLNDNPFLTKTYKVTALSKKERNQQANSDDPNKADIKPEVIKPSFKIIYNDEGIDYDVTNKMLPTHLKSLPYKVFLLNLSTGDKTVEWFMRSQGQEYQRIEDPNVLITNYGPTYFKIRLNGDDTKSLEQCITAFFSTDIVKDLEQKSGDSKDIKDTLKDKEKKTKSDFKITYKVNCEAREDPLGDKVNCEAREDPLGDKVNCEARRRSPGG